MEAWTVKENKDGTVTISKEVYEDLKRKAREYEKIVDAVANTIFGEPRK